jgi:hypothetical protein
MLNKTMVIVALLAATACLGAKTASIGSVVAHGELRVDGYAIKGSGTAFEGTIVETSPEDQSNADLLLSNGTRITLHNNSKGTLYHDHLVLDRGEADLVSSAPFRIDADGLAVRTTGTTASSRIVMGSRDTVGVMSEDGQLEVAGTHGAILAFMNPQNSRTFVRDEKGSWCVGSTSSNLYHDKDHGHDGDGGEYGHHHHHHPSR